MLRFVEGAPRLAYERSGHGPPVILLHGIGGNRQNWARQVATLRSSFTVIAWDARGYGDSGDVDGERSFSDFSDDLARLLDDLDIERAHLVGLSMGARVLMDFAPQRLERVATLVLCDCFHGFDSALTPEKQREYVELRERPLREGKSFADIAPKLIDSLVSPTCTPAVRDELRRSIEMLRVESYLKTLRASISFDRTAELHQLTMPVQLIFGGDDRLTPPSIGEDMLTLLGDARLAILDGAGHLSNLEQPAAFNETLVSFLGAHADAARFATPHPVSGD